MLIPRRTRRAFVAWDDCCDLVNTLCIDSRLQAPNLSPAGQPFPYTMPAPSNLPSERVTIRFPPVKDVEESYQLLELPPEVLAAVEGGAVVP